MILSEAGKPEQVGSTSAQGGRLSTLETSDEYGVDDISSCQASPVRVPRIGTPPGTPFPRFRVEATSTCFSPKFFSQERTVHNTEQRGSGGRPRPGAVTSASTLRRSRSPFLTITTYLPDVPTKNGNAGNRMRKSALADEPGAGRQARGLERARGRRPPAPGSEVGGSGCWSGGSAARAGYAPRPL